MYLGSFWVQEYINTMMNKEQIKQVKNNNIDEVAKMLDEYNYGNQVLYIASKMGYVDMCYLSLDCAADEYLVLLQNGVKFGYVDIVNIGLRFCEYSWLNDSGIKADLYRTVADKEGTDHYKIKCILDKYYFKNFVDETEDDDVVEVINKESEEEEESESEEEEESESEKEYKYNSADEITFETDVSSSDNGKSVSSDEEGEYDNDE